MEKKEISEYLELIEELQKGKTGNPKDLEEIKKILLKDKNLDESDLNYLTKLDVRLKRKHESPLVTTTDTVQGKTIDEYIGIVSGHAVMGMNLITDMIGGIRDVVGGRSARMESYFLDAREDAISEMISEAIKDCLDKVPGMGIEDIDAFVNGNMPAFEGVNLPELWMTDWMGARNKPLMRVTTGGTTGGTVAICGYYNVTAGLPGIDTVLAIARSDEINVCSLDSMVTLSKLALASRSEVAIVESGLSYG